MYLFALFFLFLYIACTLVILHWEESEHLLQISLTTTSSSGPKSWWPSICTPSAHFGNTLVSYQRCQPSRVTGSRHPFTTSTCQFEGLWFILYTVLFDHPSDIYTAVVYPMVPHCNISTIFYFVLLFYAVYDIWIGSWSLFRECWVWTAIDHVWERYT